MFDIVCIFLLYALQGAIQGVVFGALPLLLRRNPAATDVHQSQYSAAGYPFSIKFLIAPFIDGLYFKRVGRRESWLLPLQLLSALILLWLSGNVQSLLDATPPDVPTLTTLLFVLVAATAAGDVATDAWAAGRMDDARASVCQAVGLTVGSEFGATVFFLLMGKGLIDIQTLLFLMSLVGFAVLGIFIFQMFVGADAQQQEDVEDEVGVMEVIKRIIKVVRGPANFRWWLAFLVCMPVMGGHGSLLSVRYQAAGFSPEIFAEYDLYLLPVTLLVMWTGGKISQSQRLLSLLAVTYVFQAFLLAVQHMHYWRVVDMGEAAVQDKSLRFVFVLLGQFQGAIGTIQFVVKVAFNNRMGQRDQAIAGTVITFLASASNFGGMLPGTLVPLVADRAGIDFAAAFCLTTGSLVLVSFWGIVRRIEDFEDAGWQDGRVKAD